MPIILNRTSNFMTHMFIDIDWCPINVGPEEKYVKYSRNNTGKMRNNLQRAIARANTNKLEGPLLEYFLTCTEQDIVHEDADGNNTLHLAAYCGSNLLVEQILRRFPNLDPNVPNRDGETPVTLAIKHRGFWKTLIILLKHGGEIPADRKWRLKMYARLAGFRVTVDLIEKQKNVRVP